MIPNTSYKQVMKKLLLILFAFPSLFGYGQPDQTALEQALFNLPDVSFLKISRPGDPTLKYDLKIRQPLDHQDPSKGNFYQHIILTHRNFKNPMVMNISGYTINKSKDEITAILHANELDIEYRYFGESAPDSLRWEFLTYDQVAEDLHRINTLFKTFYAGKWVSTGISRGGQTAIIYRYFYPNDVDISIPYVAPLIKSPADKRIYNFLDTMGTDECRKRILAFQINLLKKESEIVDQLKWYARGKDIEFSYLGSIGKAFEYAVLEYPFSFWQVGYINCDQIPENGSTEICLDQLLQIVDLDFYSDKSMTDYAAHYYQTVTEGGYYSYNALPFKKYLHFITVPEPSASFPPLSVSYKTFDGSLMEKINTWLDRNGNNFLYIYGGRDTWSACRVNVSPQVNSRLYMIPGANHYTARIKNMPQDMQQDFAGALKIMLQIEPDLKNLK
jgi:hypothetical protein